MRNAPYMLGLVVFLWLLAACRPVVEVRLESGADLTATAWAAAATATATPGVDQAPTTAAPTTAAPTGAAPTVTLSPSPTVTATPSPILLSPTAPTPTPVPPTPTSVRHLPSATPELAAERIRFATGATSAVTRGHLAAGQVRRYVLRLLAGQILEVQLFSDLPAGLAIRGADGTVLKHSGDGVSGWQGTVPSSQDYTLQLGPAGSATGYGLRITAFARVQLKAGETSVTLSAPVDRLGTEGAEFAGGYVLRALAGQTMRATLSSRHGSVLLDIRGADGSPLLRYVSGSTEWEGVLPSTQDYWVQPVSVGDDTSFTLTLWFSPLSLSEPERIRFATGAVSATVGGRLVPGSYARYVLRALSGQRMEVRAVPSEIVNVTVGGPEGGFWSEPAYGEGVTIDWLPATGDYVITLALLPGSDPTDYTLEVTVQ